MITLKKIFSLFGIDTAIFFNILSRILSSFGGLITLLLITKFLSLEEQGYYYTFLSIIAVNIFFELGLNSVIVQFVAHEKSKLNINDFNITGTPQNISRLCSIFSFMCKWYLVSAFLFFLVINIFSYYFFSSFSENSSISWFYPLITLCFFTSINLFVSPFISFLEGLGYIDRVAKFRTIQQTSIILFTWLALFSGLSLFIPAIASFISLIVTLIFLSQFIRLFNQIHKYEQNEKVRYFKEIFPFQWKIALSWIGGYFIFKFFTPVIFAIEGAAAAGRMGLTLAILNVVLSVSIAWNSTKIPIYSELIANKNYDKLDNLFNITFLKSTFVNFLAHLFLIIILLFVFEYNFFGLVFSDRVIEFTPFMFLIIAFFMNHVLGSIAIYLRCHKKEPLLLNSITYGFLSSLSTVYFGSIYGVEGITLSYAIISIFITLWGIIIFFQKKKLWHLN